MSIFEQLMPLALFVVLCLVTGILIRKIVEDKWDI